MQFSPQTILENIDRQFAQLLFLPFTIFIYIPILFVSTHILGFLTIILITLGLNKAARLIPVAWARINTRAALSGVKVHGLENIKPNQSYVIVANHRSHFDILALYGWLSLDFRWVMKKELRKVPALGITCEKLGHVFIDRSDKASAKKSINDAKQELVNGTSILFFPEGTRNNKSDMLPFKQGAFKLAKELNLPVLPITINGSASILPPQTINLLPGSIELTIHPAISSDTKDITELSNSSREKIASAFYRN